MSNITSASVEKRARMMFEDSRRGAMLFKQWYSLTESERNVWRESAHAIEQTISEGLAKKIGPTE